MFKNWSKLFTTDCNVIEINNLTVYPIFRVGWTSLNTVATKKHTNNEIAFCKNIVVLIRDPKERFISGINYYCQENNLDVIQTWQLVKQGKLVDRHFVPQFIWLMHLSKFYKGLITIKPFSLVQDIAKIHKKKDPNKKVSVEVLQNFVDVDYKIMQHYNQTLPLEDIIKEYKNVLSSS